MRRRELLLGLAAAALAPRVAAAPKPVLWARWEPYQAGSRLSVDHSAWDELLARFHRRGADGIARLAYAEIDGEANARLQFYLQELERVPVSQLDRPEQRAYWINLYNATTVAIVRRHYPIASILDIRISPGLFTRGPWGAPVIRVERENLCLDDIEHRILRPIWKDPRIHYALNCASLGCPDLDERAWRAEDLDSRLDAAARRFVNHPRGAEVDGRGRLKVSSLYEWFKVDFGSRDAGVIEHLRRYAAPPLAERLASVERIEDDDYDWTLNDAAPPRAE
ncbi:MAG TPA: DUF547 domain-containing protein [Nevskiaceae bacterium]|nr:DUF547 domain-containing protein [Nevskiaceae bacterium]